uniref:PRELI/MSF1 domain-containing protein n=1 Tax=Heterorhabditis bacteriophora TaxID=37862 RepID=A0A1I7WRJ9_HETBA
MVTNTSFILNHVQYLMCTVFNKDMRWWTAPTKLYPYSFEEVVSVFWDRYPNSFAPHIISEDVLEREVTEHTIVTKKLIVKHEPRPIMGRSRKLSIICHIRASVQSYVTSTFCSQTETGRGKSAFGVYISRCLSSTTRLRPINLLATPNSFLLSTQIHPSSPIFYCSNSHTSSKPDFSHLPGARHPKSVIRDPKRVLEISPKQAQEAFQYCLEFVRSHDIDSYLSILTLPKRAQPEILAISAFNVELALVRDKLDSRKSKDTMGIYRLQFWKDALAAIYGESSMPVPRL